MKQGGLLRGAAALRNRKDGNAVLRFIKLSPGDARGQGAPTPSEIICKVAKHNTPLYFLEMRTGPCCAVCRLFCAALSTALFFQFGKCAFRAK